MYAQTLNQPDEYYFAHPALDQSQLKTFLQNPANWAYRRLHPEENKTTDALRFGTAFHAYIMGTQNVVSLEEGQTFRSKANQEWREEHEANGDLIVTYEQMEKLKRMRENLMRDNPEMFDIIPNATCEQMILWTDKETGLEMKAKPDIIPTGVNYLVDIKTAQSANGDDFRRESLKYGYPIQALFYMQAVALCEPEAFNRTSRIPQAMQFWVFEKTDACQWAPYSISLDNPVMEYAKNSIRRAKQGIRDLMDKAQEAGFGSTVDDAARYLLDGRIPRYVNELDYNDWELSGFERQNSRELLELSD